MKDQYFGDVNDYRKYAILRQLSGAGTLRTGVCWMLTAPDQRADGQAIGYLDRPESYRPFAELFDFLRRSVVVERVRCVASLEQSGLLPNAAYYSTLLPDDLHARAAFFAGMHDTFSDADLIFFDPDNGIEVPSVTKGRKGSSKYLFLDEVVRTFEKGRSVLIYQHFPREQRGQFISRLAQVLSLGTGAHSVLSFQTPMVVFLLVPQLKHEQHFRAHASQSALPWERGQIVVAEHAGEHVQCKALMRLRETAGGSEQG